MTLDRTDKTELGFKPINGGGMFEILEKVAAAFGAIVIASGTLTGLALWLFKVFGEKWLSNKFSERLEAFKHDQQKEIEHLRFEISKLLDRTTKLHQREFEVLPRAWSLLSKSYHAVKGVTAGLQTYPDISRMSAAHLEEFLSKSPLENWQKDELRSASDLNRYYQDAIFWHHAGIARKACRKSAVYLLRNGIFMPPALKEKFHKIEKLAWSALVEHELNKAHDIRPMQREEMQRLLKDGDPLMKELEAEVQKRLWSSEEAERGTGGT